MITNNSLRTQTPPSIQTGQAAGEREIKEAVSTTTQKIFSSTHLSSANNVTPTQTISTNTISVKAHDGLGLFDRVVFSKPFEKRYLAAKEAIRNPENQEHMAKTGQYSPAAKKAVDKFVSIVAGKAAATDTAAAAKKVFLEGPLTAVEEEAWKQFAAQLPDSYSDQLKSTANWQQVSKQEIQTALSKEPAFALFMDKPEGADFVEKLTVSINKKSEEMLPTDRGMALTFRFDSAYGTAGHVALGSFWRDEAGTLCMGLCHQESVPGSEKKPIWTGVTYNTLDTSKEYLGGMAPVVESMKFSGLPSVNIFPCPNPQAIVNTTKNISGVENSHPYGPTETWNNGKKWKYADKPFETCFNVTHKVMAKLFNVKAASAQTLPAILLKMRPFVSIPEPEFEIIEVGLGGKQKMALDLEITDKLPFNQQASIFQTIGETWGLSAAWDVNKTSHTQKGQVAITPGQVGINPTFAANATQFKFISFAKGLKLGTADVKPGKSYSKDELKNMIYTGKENKKLSILAATPTQTSSTTFQAKL